MALSPDPASAAPYALAVFLLLLGGLVVFVESIRPARFRVALIAAAAVIVLLVLAGELGAALVVLGAGGALAANQLFEWSTTR